MSEQNNKLIENVLENYLVDDFVKIGINIDSAENKINFSKSNSNKKDLAFNYYFGNNPINQYNQSKSNNINDNFTQMGNFYNKNYIETPYLNHNNFKTSEYKPINSNLNIQDNFTSSHNYFDINHNYNLGRNDENYYSQNGFINSNFCLSNNQKHQNFSKDTIIDYEENIFSGIKNINNLPQSNYFKWNFPNDNPILHSDKYIDKQMMFFNNQITNKKIDYNSDINFSSINNLINNPNQVNNNKNINNFDHNKIVDHNLVNDFYKKNINEMQNFFEGFINIDNKNNNHPNLVGNNLYNNFINSNQNHIFRDNQSKRNNYGLINNNDPKILYGNNFYEINKIVKSQNNEKLFMGENRNNNFTNFNSQQDIPINNIHRENDFFNTTYKINKNLSSSINQGNYISI